MDKPEERAQLSTVSIITLTNTQQTHQRVPNSVVKHVFSICFQVADEFFVLGVLWFSVCQDLHALKTGSEH